MPNDLAVIIPTHNRCPMLLRALDALTAQTFPADHFEVVVICDGCEDDTYTMLQMLGTPFRLRAVAQPASGAAAARNRGVHETNARVALFMDDDILATPELLAEHMHLHDRRGRVVVGRLLPDPTTKLAGWSRWEQHTWDRRYEALEGGATPVGGQHFFSGNVSVDRALFVAVGGFNVTLKRAEDTELGYRLQKAGARFRFNGKAAGIHCGVHSLDKWRTIQYNYGRYDVQLADAEGHRDLVPLAQWFQERNILNRWAVRAAIGRPAAQKLMLRLAHASAVLSDRAALRRSSHWSYSVIANILYWQGVADELGGARQLWQRIGAQNITHRSKSHA